MSTRLRSIELRISERLRRRATTATLQQEQHWRTCQFYQSWRLPKRSNMSSGKRRFESLRLT